MVQQCTAQPLFNTQHLVLNFLLNNSVQVSVPQNFLRYVSVQQNQILRNGAQKYPISKIESICTSCGCTTCLICRCVCIVGVHTKSKDQERTHKVHCARTLYRHRSTNRFVSQAVLQLKSREKDSTNKFRRMSHHRSLDMRSAAVRACKSLHHHRLGMRSAASRARKPLHLCSLGNHSASGHACKPLHHHSVTTISKSQCLTSVSIKDCTLRVANKTTTLFLYEQ